jgi:hypothetical protein
MRRTRKLRLRLVVAGTAGLAVVAFVAATSASPPHEPDLSNVASANTRAAGYAPSSKLSKEIAAQLVVQGSTAVENPTSLTGFYGYQNDVVSAGDPTKPQMVPTQGVNNEAQKTEPDENTYLSFKNALQGADPNYYYYGKRFLYQGHEAAVSVNGIKQGLITRINLDADRAHRVTLLATTDSNGAAINTIDGSGWDPWAGKLIFTTENANAPPYSATPDYPSTVTDISGALGRGGYEGVTLDSDGNVMIVEDIGGGNKGNTTARIPNSFLYRYIPDSPGDLTNGKLQVLQVLNNVNHQPITQATQTPLHSADQVALHVYGSSFDANWVTIHDTANGHTPFNANTLAKAADGTPFKRPENGRFRPGTGFREFYFDETGDTNATSPENENEGGWCSVFKLSQSRPGSSSARLSIFYRCDGTRAGFDNTAFLSHDLITFVEDAGDGLHGQRNALDSGWVFDVTQDYSDPSNQPVRWLAEGRDPSATIDAAAGGFGKNDGDNEITGTDVSDGETTVNGLLGAKNPHLFQDKDWRFFYTEQHGDNRTYEVVPAP